MLKEKRTSANAVVLFVMICVYYCLNVRGLNGSLLAVVRWICPVLIICVAIWNRGGRIIVPPVFVICFSVAVLLPAVLGAAPTTSLIKYCSWVLVFYGAYSYFYQLSDEEAMHKCFKILAAVLVIFQVLSFVCVILGIGEVNGRSTGITTNANTLGIYSNLAFWAGIYWNSRMKNRDFRFVWYILIATTVYTTVASGSRTAFVVLILDFLIYLLLIKQLRGTFLLVGILTVFFAVLAVTGNLAFLKIPAIDRLAEEGGTERQYLWDMAVSLWKENPLFGVGYTVSARFNKIDGMGFHNSYLSFLAECGLWGVAFLLPVMTAEIVKSLKLLTKTQNRGNIGELSYAFAMLLVLIVAAWSESFMFAVGSTEGFTFWFLFAWFMVYVRKQKYKSLQLKNTERQEGKA